MLYLCRLVAKFLIIISIQACMLGGDLQPRNVTNEEIKIYKLLLERCAKIRDVSKNLISHQPDELNSIWRYVTKSNPNMWPAYPVLRPVRQAFLDLVEQSKIAWQVDNWPSEFTTDADLPLLQGYMVTNFSFSPIGFDLEKKYAIVLRHGQQGSNAGSSELIILKKINGTWEIEVERMFAIS